MDHVYHKTRTSADAKKTKVTKYCSVPQCNNYYRKGLSFHLYPSDETLKKKWEVALRMGKPASATSRVCGEHFVPSDYFPTAKSKMPLFPHAVPTQKLPKRSVDKAVTSPRKRERVARIERVQHRNAKKMRAISEDETSNAEEQQISSPAGQNDLSLDCPQNWFSVDKGIQPTLVDERRFKLYYEDGFSFADMIAENSLDKTAQVHLSSSSHVDKDQASTSKESNSINLSEILNSDSKLSFFTGIHSIEMLDALEECVSDIDVFFKKIEEGAFFERHNNHDNDEN